MINSILAPIVIFSYIAAFSLFQRGKEKHLVVITGAMTVFDELVGELLWNMGSHNIFLTSFMSAYLLIL